MTKVSIEAALLAAGDNRREAARALGIAPPTLYKWMHRHGIPTGNGGVSGASTVSTSETASTLARVNNSHKSFESNGQAGVKGPTLRAVATQAAVPAVDSARDSIGRSARTVYMTDEHWKALHDAGIDVAFYTRQKMSTADVVGLLIESQLPALLREVREKRAKSVKGKP